MSASASCELDAILVLPCLRFSVLEVQKVLVEMTRCSVCDLPHLPHRGGKLIVRHLTQIMWKDEQTCHGSISWLNNALKELTRGAGYHCYPLFVPLPPVHQSSL